ncbi:hypothetical protein ACMFMF_011475 [Clarireedia jacksonii]
MQYCGTWYLVTDTFVYTSLLCSSRQSWQTFTATAFTKTGDTSDFPFSAFSSATLVSTSVFPKITAASSSTPAVASNEQSPTPSATGEKEGSSRTAVAVGGAIGGVGAVCIIATAIFFSRRCLKRHRRKHIPVATTEAEAEAEAGQDQELDGQPMSPELDGGDASRFSKNSLRDMTGEGNEKRGITESRRLSEIDGQHIQEMPTEDRAVELPA